MQRFRLVSLLLACLFLSTVSLLAQEEGRLLRFPTLSKDRIAFTYGGDLWIAPREGGMARRVTTHPGLELMPRFSPDGKWLAFTAQYDGNFNLYVMPGEGGEARQLTFEPDAVTVSERMGPNNMAVTWTPDSKRIVFLSRRSTYNDWFGQMFTVGLEGGLPERLPVPRGANASFNADGTKMVYNDIFRNFRTWKRYTGGMAQEVYLYDLKTYDRERLTDYVGTDAWPLWAGESVYFASDRDKARRMNLHKLDLASKKVTQVTSFTEFDVEWPSLGPGGIAFANGGRLYVLDLATDRAAEVKVLLPGDRDLRRTRWEKVKDQITAWNVSGDGKRAVFSARGDLFTVPAENGPTRNLTRTPGVYEKYGTWSPDGKWIAYVSDETGEEEIWVVGQSGREAPRRVTTDGSVWRYPLLWSPDGKKLAWSDRKCRLWYVEVDGGKPVQVDRSEIFEIRQYRWSPDSAWLAYVKGEPNQFSSLWLYSVASKQAARVTDGTHLDSEPVFDPNGKVLYFVSERTLNPVLGAFDTSYAYVKTSRLYALALAKDGANPFAPRSDEAGEEAKKKEADEKAAAGKEEAPAAEKAEKTEKAGKAGSKEEPKAEEEKKPEPVKIDLDGLAERIVVVPAGPGSLGHLAASGDALFYLSAPVGGLGGPLPGEEPSLHRFKIEDRKDEVVLSPVDSYELSANGKKILYAARGSYGIVDADKTGAKPGDGALDLSGLELKVDPVAEWKQMFEDSWRRMRDMFFQAEMNGVDWGKERQRYAALLPYVSNRYDLTYLLGEMIGELANSHTYVGAGDYPEIPRVNVGYLGADFAVDPSSGRYRFARIYAGWNWDEAARSPLTEPGVGVKEGDYLLAIDGADLKAPQTPYQALENAAGRAVTLKVGPSADPAKAREVTVKTIDSEYPLHYQDWVESNRRKVEQASGGKVGYVYIPDMGEEGLNEFVRQYYPQIRKEGLIVDVRYNGGGFVDQMILERLRRVLVGMGIAREGAPGTVPDQVFHGHMAAICNEYSASDGDIFSEYWKAYKLGPLVGKRTWGGVRGIRGGLPLMDGGYLFIPEFSLYGLDGKWAIENHGVEPDIEVEDTPKAVLKGGDPQLEKALELVLQAIQREPRRLPPPPPPLPAYPAEALRPIK